MIIGLHWCHTVPSDCKNIRYKIIQNGRPSKRNNAGYMGRTANRWVLTESPWSMAWTRSLAMSSNRKYHSDKLTESYHLVPLLPAGDSIQTRNLFDVLMFFLAFASPTDKILITSCCVSKLWEVEWMKTLAMFFFGHAKHRSHQHKNVLSHKKIQGCNRLHLEVNCNPLGPMESLRFADNSWLDHLKTNGFMWASSFNPLLSQKTTCSSKGFWEKRTICNSLSSVNHQVATYWALVSMISTLNHWRYAELGPESFLDQREASHCLENWVKSKKAKHRIWNFHEFSKFHMNGFKNVSFFKKRGR